MAFDFSVLNTSPSNYKKQRDLAILVSDNPSDTFGEGNMEDRPYSQKQLDDAIAQAKKPGELDALLEEKKNRKFTKSSGFDFSVLEDNETKGKGFDFSVLEDSKEAPGWIPSIAQSFVGGGGDVIKFAAGAGGSLVNALTGSDIADPLIKKGEEMGEAANTSILSQEEQANRTLPQKIAGGLVQAPYAFLGGQVAAPALAGAMGTFNTGSELLKQGADLGEAQTAAMASGPISAAAMAVPGLGSTIPRSVAMGVGTNIASTVAEKTIIQQVMADKPEIAAKYKVTGEDLIVAGVQGAVFGAGMHKIHEYGVKQQEKADIELTKNINDSLNTLQDQVDNIAPQRIKSGYTLEEIITEHSRHAHGRTYNVGDMYDAVIAHKDTTPAQKELAKALLRLNDTLGTNEVPIKQQLFPFGPEAQYGWNEKLNKGKLEDAISHYLSDPRDISNVARVLLHESVHAATSVSIRFWENSIKNGVDPKTLTEKQKFIFDKVSTLNDIFTRVKTEHAKLNNDIDPVLDLKRMKEANKQNIATNADIETFKKKYGFKDLHEFVAESLTNKDFQQYLKDIKLTLEERRTYSTPRGVISNAWDLVKRTIKSIIGGDTPHSMLDVALDHSFDLIESSFQRGRAARELTIKDAQAKQGENKLTDFYMRRISDLLDHSGGDRDMFETRLRAEQGNKSWQDFVTRNLNTLWENGRRIREVVGENKAYKNLSKSDQMFQHEPRNADEFKEQEIPTDTKLVEADDLKAGGTNVFSQNITNISKAGTIAGKIKKFFTEKANEYKVLQAVVFHSAMEQFSAFNKMAIKDKKIVMDVAIKIDNRLYREKLQERNLQWPDEEMLKQDFPHLTPEHIKAYGDITRGLDFLHNLLNQTRRVRGMEDIPQIPGYMPHVFDGAYKVFITTKNASGETRVVGVKGFKTSWGAMAEVKRIKSGATDSNGVKFDVETDSSTRLPYKIQKSGDLTSGIATTLEQHLNAYYNQLELSPEAKQALDKIERDSMQGFNKHELERSDIDGFIGAFGVQEPGGIGALKERLGILSGENKKILSLYENYARSVTNHYKNVLWVNEIASRFLTSGMNGDKPNFGMLLAQMPKLNKHLSEFSYNVTGENLNKLSWVDDFFRELSIKLGIDPNLYRGFARDARNILSLTKLRANPANYVANFLQPAHMLSLLQFVNATRGGEGLRSPNVAATFAKVIKNRLNPDEYHKAAIQWAKEQHILDPQLEPEMRGASPSKLAQGIHTATLGDVNPKIETIGRTTSFMMAVEHFRQIYPDDPMAVRRAAANLMEMGMVNYDRSSRPLMYQNFGVVGEAISPFAVFRNAYFGNMYLMIKLAAKNPTNLANFAPLLMMQTTYLLTAGAFGMIGASEYNLIAKEINDHFPSWHLPTLEEMLYKMKVPDAVTYGVISELTKHVPGLSEGVNMGGSMNAVGVDDLWQAAMVPYVEAMATVVGLSAQTIGAKLFSDSINPPTSAELFKAGKQIVPGIAHKYLEDAVKTNPNVGINTQGYGDTTRTEAGDLSLMLTGKKSVTETKEGSINFALKQGNQQVTKEITNLVKLAADYSENKDVNIQAVRKRAMDLGQTVEEFSDKVVDEIMKRRTTTRQRESEKSTIKAQRSQYERREME